MASRIAYHIGRAVAKTHGSPSGSSCPVTHPRRSALVCHRWSRTREFGTGEMVRFPGAGASLCDCLASMRGLRMGPFVHVEWCILCAVLRIPFIFLICRRIGSGPPFCRFATHIGNGPLLGGIHCK